MTSDIKHRLPTEALTVTLYSYNRYRGREFLAGKGGGGVGGRGPESTIKSRERKLRMSHFRNNRKKKMISMDRGFRDKG